MSVPVCVSVKFWSAEYRGLLRGMAATMELNKLTPFSDGDFKLASFHFHPVFIYSNFHDFIDEIKRISEYSPNNKY